jgi:cysteine-rich repeat protein
MPALNRTVLSRLSVSLVAAAIGCLHADVPVDTMGESSSSSGGDGSCGDGTCDPGEDNTDCPADCEPEIPGSCGDGIVDEAEQCDGSGEDVADCDDDCTQVMCGDGHINAAAGELCDDGADNSDDYAPAIHCATTCLELAPHCGDGTCQAGDELASSCPADCDAVCGDGITDIDETCDAGRGGEPADAADCDQDCSAAMCGDGYLNPVAGEECDDGDRADDDECVAGCTAARCGDGHVWLEMEECDDGNAVPDDACSDACALPRRVFVTSEAYKGDLLPAVGDSTGVELGDAHCQELASAAGLTGTYLAWLASERTSPVMRLDVGFTGAYQLVDGTVLAVGWADLVDGMLAHQIDLDEKGEPANGENAWTGTAADGTAAAASCLGWTSAKVADLGTTGITDAIDATWTSVFDVPCSLAARMYCVEQ